MIIKKVKPLSFLKISSKFWLNYILVICSISLISSNILLTFSSLFILPIIIKNVWRKNEPPIFVLILLFHWLQITIKVFHADFLNVNVEDIALSSSTNTAIYLSLFCLLILSIGINIAIKKIQPISKNILFESGHSLSIKKLFTIYILFEIFNILVPGIGSIIPALSSFLSNIANLKIIFIYIIFVVSFIQRKYRILLFIVFLETIQGFSGFFSSYKAIYFILILAYFTVYPKISIKKIFKVSPLVFLLLLLTIVWSSIKVDYRFSVSQGDKVQSVKVSANQQIDIYFDLLSNLDRKKMILGAEALANRLEYVDFFGQAIDYVPKYKDFEYGTLWLGTIKNILMPRIFFPNKPVLDDSERTIKYTGIWRSGAAEGASIGLGYFAESYIDFGMFFMWFPLFLLGFLYGYIYRYFVQNKKEILYYYAISVYVLYDHYLFETRNDKIIGALFMTFLIVLLLRKLLFKIYKLTKNRNIAK